MQMQTAGLQGPLGLAAQNKISQETSQENQGFQEVLLSALNKVNNNAAAAENASIDLAMGKSTELHQVMFAVEQADLALQLTIQIRNKVLEAYQEVMRMQV